MRICSRAVEIDPYYAQAWALLAIAQSNLRYTFGREVDDGFAAANAALSIDPGIAEAHCAMSRRLEEQQRVADAVAEIETALRLDPDSWEVNKEAGRLAKAERRFADSARHYEKAVEVMENDFHAWAMLTCCYQALADRDGVQRGGAMMVSQAEKALAQDPSNGAALGIGAGGLAITGQHERAKEWIDRAMMIDPDNHAMRYNFACVLAAYMDDKKAAFALLATTLPQSRAHLMASATDPDLDGLRDDPRFMKLLADSKKRFGIEDAPAPKTGGASPVSANSTGS